MKAFPNGMITDDRGVIVSSQPGMDLRDYFAAEALPAVIADPDTKTTAQITKQDFRVCAALISYGIADAMMEARK